MTTQNFTPTASGRSGHIKKPKWLKTNIPTGKEFFDVKRDLRSKNLYTVCEEAKCPNIGECWATFTATFMILGDTCTRACRFCNVKTGNPNGWLDAQEPDKIAESVRIMKLDYVVITMVDRDDLPDYGAEHIANVVGAVHSASPKTKIEFLGGDMAGESEPLRRVLSSNLDVFAHNIETVKRLSPRVRDARAAYQQSIDVLAEAKSFQPEIFTKSAIMLGLGEKPDEVLTALQDLRAADVDLVTIGQYMRPTKRHLSIKEFVSPEIFDELGEAALDMGFLAVASGPLVRSSYKARDFYNQAVERLVQRLQ
tara:strand:+ start:830 stop:1759 length:930 start_codon:yes stop_codon:yes gene_type:complete